MPLQPEAAVEPESETYIFSARELSRLAVYRAAIVAGFYTDECASTRRPARKSLYEENRSQHKQPQDR